MDENETKLIEDAQRNAAMLLVGIGYYYLKRFNEQWNKFFHQQKG